MEGYQIFLTSGLKNPIWEFCCRKIKFPLKKVSEPALGFEELMYSN